MKATLLVMLGETTDRHVTLRLPCVLGRSREADVAVPHPVISRRHCRLSETDGLLMLRDLDSLNGTMIGGRRIATAPLPPDAEFTIGPLTFRVQYEYKGDLTSLPQITFVDDATAAAADMAEVTAPVVARGNAEIKDVQSLAAWADADPEAASLALPALARLRAMAEKRGVEPKPAAPPPES